MSTRVTYRAAFAPRGGASLWLVVEVDALVSVSSSGVATATIARMTSGDWEWVGCVGVDYPSLVVLGLTDWERDQLQQLALSAFRSMRVWSRADGGGSVT